MTYCVLKAPLNPQPTNQPTLSISRFDSCCYPA